MPISQLFLVKNTTHKSLPFAQPNAMGIIPNVYKTLKIKYKGQDGLRQKTDVTEVQEEGCSQAIFLRGIHYER